MVWTVWIYIINYELKAERDFYSGFESRSAIFDPHVRIVTLFLRRWRDKDYKIPSLPILVIW